MAPDSIGKKPTENCSHGLVEKMQFLKLAKRWFAKLIGYYFTVWVEG